MAVMSSKIETRAFWLLYRCPYVSYKSAPFSKSFKGNNLDMEFVLLKNYYLK